jgi:hypothetical protein
MNKRKCLECKKVIFGRADKKFCGDMCRSSYHNQNIQNGKSTVKNINSVLRNNRKIILHLMKNIPELEVSELTLKELGFKFDFCTNVQMSKNAIPCINCYEFSYYKTENKTYRILREPNFEYA